MNKAKLLIGFVLASMALASCDKADNPIDSGSVNIDNPQEEVTDQPAADRQR